jgi:hypothetical protein
MTQELPLCIEGMPFECFSKKTIQRQKTINITILNANQTLASNASIRACIASHISCSF